MRNVIKVSNENNHFQHVEVLKRNREKRTRYGKFLVEGVSQINLAIKYGWEIESLIYSGERRLSTWARDLLEKTKTESQLEMTDVLVDKLSDKDEPSEILAVCKFSKHTLDSIEPRDKGLVIVFDRPSSPGNLGTSIRSADAFGANALIITGHSVDMYDPHVVRGSMGALFALPVTRAESHEEVLRWVESARFKGFPYRIIGTSAQGDTSLERFTFDGPTVLIFGNETSGLSRGYKEICEDMVKIPIGGELSSINVSCAASIVLYEFRKQQPRRAD